MRLLLDESLPWRLARLLAARSTALVDLTPLVPELLQQLPVYQARTLVRIGGMP